MSRYCKIFKNRVIFYILVFSAMLIKYFPFGLRYFTYQDDSIQYGLPHIFHNDLWQNYIIKNNLLTLRPLAALLDVYVIAPLWDHLWIILLIMILLHLATIYFLDEIFSVSGILWGRAAIIAFALYPLLAEATYWISASSRLVVSLFFCVLSIYLLLLFIEKRGTTPNKVKWLIFSASIIIGIIAQGFYEQVISFCFIFSLLILFKNRKRIHDKFVYAIPCINFILIGVYYFCFRNTAALEKRGQVSIWGLFSNFENVVKNISDVFLGEQKYTIVYTIKKGFFVLLYEHPLLFLLVLTVSLLLTIFIHMDDQFDIGKKDIKFSIVSIFVIFIVPFAPFFILQDSFVYLRNIYLSIIAIAMIVQLLWHFSIRLKPTKIIISVLAFTITVTSICCNIFEVEGLRITEKYNKLISKNIIRAIENINRSHSQVYIFNVRNEYEPMPSPHFESATMSHWSFTGQIELATETMHENFEKFYITPILSGEIYNMPLMSREILLIGLDQDLQARELFIENDVVYFVGTRIALGYIESDLENEIWEFNPC